MVALCKAEAKGLASFKGRATLMLGASLYFTTAPMGSGNPVGRMSTTFSARRSYHLRDPSIRRYCPRANLALFNTSK